jgi:hypothetical protein
MVLQWYFNCTQIGAIIESKIPKCRERYHKIVTIKCNCAVKGNEKAVYPEMRTRSLPAKSTRFSLPTLKFCRKPGLPGATYRIIQISRVRDLGG